MAEALVIGGTTLNRVTANVTLIRCTPFVKDGVPTFTFAQRGATLATIPSYLEKTFSYTLPSGTLLFTGDVKRMPVYHTDGLGWVAEFEAMGLKKRGDYIPVTDSNTGTDTARFNLHPDDPNVIPARQGRNVGQIITSVLTMTDIATALNAAGLCAYTSMSPPTLPSSTASDLAALTYVPPFEVDVVGESVLRAIEGIAQIGNPNVFMHVDHATGAIRFLDITAFTPTTLTFGSSDRVGLPSLTRDPSGCYSRVVIRGNTLVQAVTVKTAPWPGSSNTDGGLQEDYGHDGLTNADAKTKWKASDWSQPGQPTGEATGTATLTTGAVTGITPVYGGYGYGSAPAVHISGGGGTGATATAVLTSGAVTSYTITAGGSGYTSAPTVLVDPPGTATVDIGTCTCPSTTTITLTSSNSGVHWPSGFWDQANAQGYLTLYSDALTGVNQHWQARVTTCPSMSPGGTCTVTIDNPVPSTNYNAYLLQGLGAGASVVGRKLKVANANIGAALQPYFPYPVPYRSPDGLSASLTSTPSAYVLLSVAGTGTAPFYYRPVGFTVDPTTGHIYLNKPAQLVYSIDQVTPVWPDDIQAFLAVADGTLTAVYPPDSGGPVYAGTSYTVEGVQRTKYITVNDWRDYSNQTGMNAYAETMWNALANTVVEGTVPYYGLMEALLVPGVSLNLAASYTTGWEAIAVPIVSVDLDFHETLNGLSYDTTCHVSNRRAPYSGTLFSRPSQTGLNALSGAEGFGYSLSGAAAVEGLDNTGKLAGSALSQAGYGPNEGEYDAY